MQTVGPLGKRQKSPSRLRLLQTRTIQVGTPGVQVQQQWKNMPSYLLVSAQVPPLLFASTTQEHCCRKNTIGASAQAVVHSGKCHQFPPMTMILKALINSNIGPWNACPTGHQMLLGRGQVPEETPQLFQALR